MMTQLTFDFSVSTGSATTATVLEPPRHTPKREAGRYSNPTTLRQPTQLPTPAPLHGSLPVTDPSRGEIHHMGDLAQLVLARYDIVRRRRAARLAREAARDREAAQGREASRRRGA